MGWQRPGRRLVCRELHRPHPEAVRLVPGKVRLTARPRESSVQDRVVVVLVDGEHAVVLWA
jgi:hypothetical protein